MAEAVPSTSINETKGLYLGFIAIFIFASTLPITKIAVGGVDNPALAPTFVTMARAAGAGFIALFFLLQKRFPIISRKLWPALFLSAICSVFGFPFFLAIGLRTADPTHAAVITGLMPLFTAVCAALYFKQKPSMIFWLCSVLGAGIILLFILLVGNGHIRIGDLFLILAVLSASIGYVAGAKVSATVKPVYVISWALLICLPVSAGFSYLHWPSTQHDWQVWLAVIYLALFAMWIAFIVWYRALVIGGTVRVSQIQLVQPFIALLLCWPMLGEQPSQITYIFLCILMAIVYLSRKTRAS